MQGYYNTIPMYGIGGLIAKIVKAVGSKNIQRQANLIGKKNNKELFNLLSKLSKSEASGTKLEEKELKKLVRLAQDYRRKNVHYNARRQKFNEELVRKRAAAQNQAQQGIQPKDTSTPAQPESPNPIPGTTLSGRWKQLKNWMNNHPALTVGVPLFAASGIGRDILGGIGSIYTARPFSSDSEENKQKSVVTIDGVDIPITMGDNGKFVVDTTGGKKPKTTPEDDIDSLIDAAAATSNVANTLPSDPNSNIPVSDQSQQMINTLFADDQWD